MARASSDERQSLSSDYRTSYTPSYTRTYTTISLTFAEAIRKVVANEMTATEVFRQLPAELRKEVDGRCMAAFGHEFSGMSAEHQKMVLVTLASASSPEHRRKAMIARVLLLAVFGALAGLTVAGVFWAANSGFAWAFAWDLGRGATASLGWWVGWPAAAALAAVGLGAWRGK